MDDRQTPLSKPLRIIDTIFILAVAVFLLDIVHDTMFIQSLGFLALVVLVPAKIYLYSGIYGVLIELASGQDDSTWNDKIRGRRNDYCTPRMVVPFINRLIQVGALPVPTDKYKVVWPDPETLKPAEAGATAGHMLVVFHPSHSGAPSFRTWDWKK